MCDARATLHEVTLSNRDLFQFERRRDISVFLKYAQPSWRRGDVITVRNARDYRVRNRAKVFWTGDGAAWPGNMEYEDYMCIPKQFPVGSEYHPLYWSDVWDKTYPLIQPVFRVSDKARLHRLLLDGDFTVTVEAADGTEWTVINDQGPDPYWSTRRSLYKWDTVNGDCHTLYTVASL